VQNDLAQSSPKKFNVQDYLTAPELKQMYALDFDLLLQQQDLGLMVLKTIKHAHSHQYFSLGEFLNSMQMPELMELLQKLENPDIHSKEFAESTLVATMLAYVEGTTCLSILDLTKYRSLLYFQVKLIMMCNTMELKCNTSSFTLDLSLANRHVFPHMPLEKLYHLHQVNGPQVLFLYLRSRKEGKT